MTEEKEFCKFYQKGRKCNLKQDDFRCIENIGGNCASYRYYTFELEQENNELKKQIESQKGLITVGGKQQYQYLQRVDELEQENRELKEQLLEDKILDEHIESLSREDKYRSALEEIKEIAFRGAEGEDCSFCYSIFEKINEVLQ